MTPPEPERLGVLQPPPFGAENIVKRITSLIQARPEKYRIHYAISYEKIFVPVIRMNRHRCDPAH